MPSAATRATSSGTVMTRSLRSISRRHWFASGTSRRSSSGTATTPRSAVFPKSPPVTLLAPHLPEKLGGQAVADAPHGFDLHVGAELAAQRRDVRVQRARGRLPVRLPHLVDDEVAADHLTGPGREQREQVELLAGERQRRAVEGGDAGWSRD